MAHNIFQTLSDFFSKYGYWAVFFGVMLENAGIPIPGETILLFAGFLAYHEKLDLVPAILVAIAGATCGDSLGFLVGHYGGRPFVEKVLRKIPLVAKSFSHAQSLFLKYGQWAVFSGRFIAGLRMFAGILAGLFQMPYPRFLFFNLTGAVAWAITITYVGFMFGSSWQLVQQHLKRLDEIVFVAVLLAILAGVIAYYLNRKKSPT
ncbi:MAG TPA: DedA family protein [Terriglobia bacterium]|nr:DedA family protein [Terriglobia bacterium]